jgi:hypothetical protein
MVDRRTDLPIRGVRDVRLPVWVERKPFRQRVRQHPENWWKDEPLASVTIKEPVANEHAGILERSEASLRDTLRGKGIVAIQDGCRDLNPGGAKP